MPIKIFLFITIFLCAFNVSAQQKNNLVELSGIVMTSDSLAPVIFCNIGIKNSYRGTSSNINGFFSIVMEKGDTLVFSAVGYQRKLYAVPDTLEGSRYSIIQLMSQDTINLPETIIYPWPKPHEFKSAFLALDIPDDDITRARKNLSEEQLKMRAYVMRGDAIENYNWQQKQRTAAYWHYKQPPPINLLNPFAWAEFIKAWKRGDFKRKRK